MRVLRTLACVLTAGGFLVGVAPPVVAQPREKPPKLDVRLALDALADEPVYRAPGAVARIDEARVRQTIDADTKVLIAPYTGRLEAGNNYADSDAYAKEVYEPLTKWAKENRKHLIYVEGIAVRIYGDPSSGYGPSDIPELRQVTAYLDVSTPVIACARYASGMDTGKADDFERVMTAPVPPSREQVDEVAERLREDPVYNAPGREDPIDPRMALVARELGITVRVAAFPTPELGEPIRDYGPELLKRFPDDVIMVAHGRWLDVASADQTRAEAARDYAYGRFEGGSFTQGSLMQDRVGTVLERLQFLRKKTAYGRPQPQAQPEPRPYDVRRTISDLAPWVLVGAGLILAVAGLFRWRWSQADKAAAERRAMRGQSAAAAAKISELGAEVLAAAERGDEVPPDAAERLATARTVYDRALTAKAMAEVAAVADEGLEAMR